MLERLRGKTGFSPWQPQPRRCRFFPDKSYCFLRWSLAAEGRIKTLDVDKGLAAT